MKEKRIAIAAVILSACMLLQSNAHTAFSENNVNGIGQLKNIGIIKGDLNGNLRENDYITRAEFASVLKRAFKTADTDRKYFNDVDKNHRAYGDINSLAENGIITGDGDGNFRPSQNIKFEEAAKILVNIYCDENNTYVDEEYPYGYILKAAKLKITEGVESYAGEDITRAAASQMILNTLYNHNDAEPIGDKKLSGIYYVSQNGSDDNAGTYRKPLKSVDKALSVMNSNDTMILLSGDYDIGGGFSVKDNGIKIYGKCGDRVRLSCNADSAIEIWGDDICIGGVDFVCSERADEQMSSPFIVINGNGVCVSECTFKGLKYPIKIEGKSNSIIEKNNFSSSETAVKTENGQNILIKNNKINYPGKNGIVLSNTSGGRISNNIFYGENETGASIYLTDGTSDSIIWNNAVVLENAVNASAVKLNGASNCRIYNNTISGGKSAIEFAGDKAKNASAVIINNIFSGCGLYTYGEETLPNGTVCENNLFDNTYPKQNENYAKYGNAKIKNINNDWQINMYSNAAGSGQSLYAKESIDFTDMYGNAPGDKWNIGASQTFTKTSSEEQNTVFTDGSIRETFSNGANDWEGVMGTWEVIDNIYMNTTVTGRNSSYYKKSADWTDFEFSADLKTPMETKTACCGIIFRADKNMQNQYAIRFYANESLEFVMWNDNVFKSVMKFPYVTNPGEVYNLKVKATGSEFTFYVNDEEVGKASDSTFSSGAVGFYAYQQMYEFDNAVARQIK